MQTPMMNSTGKMRIARAQESSGMKTRDEIKEAKAAFNCSD